MTGGGESGELPPYPPAPVPTKGQSSGRRTRSRPDPLNYQIRLNNKIAALMRQMESADARPTDQQVEVFRDLSTLLQVELDRIDEAIRTDLARLNALLVEAGLEPIALERPVV